MHTRINEHPENQQPHPSDQKVKIWMWTPMGMPRWMLMPKERLKAIQWMIHFIVFVGKSVMAR
jgi:hypothetical protein